MRFMLLLHQTEANIEIMRQPRTPEQAAQAMEPFFRFTSWCGENGVDIVAGDALLTPDQTKTMTREGDEFVVTDGPFLELREHLGGFYIIECADMDTALKAAEMCPLSAATEVRQLRGLPVVDPAGE